MSMNAHHLYRSRDDRILAGVAGGLADLWDADPSLVRIVWALLVILTGGIALVIYIVMALVVPDEDDVLLATPAVGTDDPAAASAASAASATSATSAASPAIVREQMRTARREARAARRAARSGEGRGRSGAVVVGVLFVLLGVWFLVREYLPTVDWDWFWPAALVGLGVVVLALALRPESRDGGRGTAGQGSVPS
jgi:phage shock protein PspC (stress-responsive transcriptional regulator)